eukprot:scaffold1226_cov250-Pinguiococcus_pyrenoidosus.AAC.2
MREQQHTLDLLFILLNLERGAVTQEDLIEGAVGLAHQVKGRHVLVQAAELHDGHRPRHRVVKSLDVLAHVHRSASPLAKPLSPNPQIATPFSQFTKVEPPLPSRIDTLSARRYGCLLQRHHAAPARALCGPSWPAWPRSSSRPFRCQSRWRPASPAPEQRKNNQSYSEAEWGPVPVSLQICATKAHLSQVVPIMQQSPCRPRGRGRVGGVAGEPEDRSRVAESQANVPRLREKR